MFGSELLDVVIGMVFVFLLLSLICSAVNELLETRLKNRAGDLEKASPVFSAITPVSWTSSTITA